MSKFPGGKNERMEREIEEREEIRQRKVDAGRKGAAKRWQENSTTNGTTNSTTNSSANGDAIVLPSRLPIASTSTSTSTNSPSENNPPNPPRGDWDDVFPTGSLNESKTDQKRIRVLRTNPKMEFLGKWFGRKPETLWSVSEAKALRDLSPPKEEIELINKYRSIESDIHRTSIQTLLNNWHTELDRARTAIMQAEKTTGTVSPL